MSQKQEILRKREDTLCSTFSSKCTKAKQAQTQYSGSVRLSVCLCRELKRGLFNLSLIFLTFHFKTGPH